MSTPLEEGFPLTKVARQACLLAVTLYRNGTPLTQDFLICFHTELFSHCFLLLSI